MEEIIKQKNRLLECVTYRVGTEGYYSLAEKESDCTIVSTLCFLGLINTAERDMYCEEIYKAKLYPL